MTKHTLLSVFFFSFLLTALNSKGYDAPYAEQAPLIDGFADEQVWHAAQWHPIDQLILGSNPSGTDFQGRFKAIWTSNKLYVLAEIIDDVLIDTHQDALSSYWEDDTLEVFIDEDQSGGDHLNNYNAFAYHIALDNQAVDINQKGEPRLLNQHINSVWKRSASLPNAVIWEVSIDVHSDQFKDEYKDHESPSLPITLSEGKKMGFLVAYCDSDGSDGRESFISSHDVAAVNGDKNRAYIDASVFASITLVK